MFFRHAAIKVSPGIGHFPFSAFAYPGAEAVMKIFNDFIGGRNSMLFYRNSIDNALVLLYAKKVYILRRFS